VRFIDSRAVKHYLQGHSFRVADVTRALEECLVRWDSRNGKPSAMLDAVARHPGQTFPGPLFEGQARTLISVFQISEGERNIVMTKVAESDHGSGLGPLVIFQLHSRALDIPMRVELPLRAILIGTPPAAGMHLVYLHVLEDSNENEWKYYGITSRDWNVRFMEHLGRRSAQGAKSRMTRKLSSLSESRLQELRGEVPSEPALRSIASVICAFGLSPDEADQVEEEFIDRHSLKKTHNFGLNDLPGGKKGRQIAMDRRTERSKI